MPVQEVACPNCGAPVDFPDNKTLYVKCKFCGTSIARTDLPAEPAPPPPKAEPVMVTFQPQRSITPKRSGIAGGIFIFSIVACLAIIGVSAALFTTSSNVIEDQVAPFLDGIENDSLRIDMLSDVLVPSVNIYSFGKIQMFSRSEMEGTSFVTLSTEADGSFLTYLDTASASPARWRIPSGEIQSSVDIHYAVDEKRVFFVTGDRISALDRQTGQTIWQASLSDKLPYDCPACLVATDQTLVVLTDDGRLAGIVLETGVKAWDVTLTGTPDTFVVSGGLVLLKDEAEEPLFRMFDPANGAEVHSVTPACPNDTFSDSPQYPDQYDPLLADRDSFYVFAGWYEPACLQKWDTASGQMYYQVTFPNEYFLDATFYPYVFKGQTIFSASYDKGVAFNTVDGTYTAFSPPQDYRFEALAIESEVFIVKATESRGTPSDEIWGLDASGSRLWTYKPKAQYMMTGGSDIVSSDDWFYMVIPGKLLVFEASSDPDTLTLEVLDIKTGVSTGVKPIELGTIESIIFYVRPLGFTDGRAWLMVDNKIIGIDPTTGGVTFRWPG